VAEKILAPGEPLPSDWPVHGTSGYDFLNMAAGLLVAPEGMRRLRQIYGNFTGEPIDFPPIAHDKKLNVELEALGSDVNRLTNLFVAICESNREQRDFTRAEVRRAIREVAACFAIYRTYVVPDRDEITEEDRTFIENATQCGKTKRLDIDGALFDFIRDVLTLKIRGQKESEFVSRFQQFTSPVMAKGVEDTAFYCFNRLTSLNEVGADPGRDGVTVEEFHGYNQKMQQTHPDTMLTLSTHDTKRSDDVRARLAVLSEIPKDFGKTATRWSRSNARFRTGKFPDKGTEWFLYQTMVGAWPIDAERLKQYMQKAMREAKTHTSWVANNEQYENAVNSYIDAILADTVFLEDMTSFVEKILHAGRVNSLAQTLMKYTAPGVPDLYQGSELWDLSLVDPDNRRPVDYDLRRKLLAEAETLDAAQVLARMDEGLPKLWLIHRALRLREQRSESFCKYATYAPLSAIGDNAEHAIAYLRDEKILTVVPRWTTTLGGKWGDTTLEIPEGTWMNQLTGERIEAGTARIESLLRDFPVALLAREN